MKILIVAEDIEVCSQISDFMNSMGFDVIKYRWLMKAMDNVEEISPQLIFISAQDYPRQWKTFLQYIEGINLNSKIILYTQAVLNNDEEEKAEFLGVNAVINDFSEKSKNAIKKVLELQEGHLSLPNDCKFVFTNPKTGKFVNGKVVSYFHPLLVFEPYNKDEITSLRFGQTIDNCTLKKEKSIFEVRAQIQSINDKIEFCLLTK